jgi:hypothetical protein
MSNNAEQYTVKTPESYPFTIIGEGYVTLKEAEQAMREYSSELIKENERLKKNYDGMKHHCDTLTKINVANMRFDEGESEWKKRNDVKEGENFIDWYLRTQSTLGAEGLKELLAAREENKLYREALISLQKLRGLDPWIGDEKMRRLFQNTFYPAVDELSKFQPKKDENVR